jgi:hypothetical protein
MKAASVATPMKAASVATPMLITADVRIPAMIVRPGDGVKGEGASDSHGRLATPARANQAVGLAIEDGKVQVTNSRDLSRRIRVGLDDVLELDHDGRGS